MKTYTNSQSKLKRILAAVAIVAVAFHTPVYSSNMEASADNAAASVTEDFSFYINSGDKAVITRYKGADTEVTIPTHVVNSNGVTYEVGGIDEGAFDAEYLKVAVKEVNIPEGIKYIYSEAFCNSTVENISIPESVISIGKEAFYNCSNIESITIPSGVKTIGALAFSECPKLVSLKVDANNPDFSSDNNVLYSKDKKKLIHYPSAKADSVFSVPDGVTEISGYAFYGCNNLKKIIIPDSVTTVGDYAFENCTKLTSIVIGSGLTSIIGSAFSNSGVSEIIVDENNANFVATGGFILSKDRSTVEYAPNKESVTIPDTITKIGDYAFYNHDKLKSITIPSSVRSIGSWAFAKCKALTDMEIPDTVDAIYDSAFSGSGLKKLVIPDSVATFGECCFKDCVSLETVDLPNSVTSIVYGDFAGCTSLKNIDIPSSVWELKNYALYESYNLTDIVIPKEVRSIKESAIVSPSQINVYSGSYAEKYAIENGIPHNVIGGKSYVPTGVSVQYARRDYIEMKWNAVEGAESYNIYRRLGDRGYKVFIGSTTETCFTYDNYRYGEGYQYCITSVRENGAQSGYSEFITDEMVYKPKIHGTISGFGDLSGKITIKLLDSKRNVVGTVQSDNGYYSFSNITEGENYTLSVSMNGCPPREYPVTAGGTGSEINPEIRRYGDVSGDGVIDAKDATQILRYEAGLPSVFTDANGAIDSYLISVGNALGSGILSAKDATQILRHEAGLSSVFDSIG